MRYTIPPVSQIRKMREVTDGNAYKTGLRGRTFVNPATREKYVFVESLKRANTLESISRAIRSGEPTLSIQTVLARRGRVLRQNYLDGVHPKRGAISTQQVSQVSRALVKLHGVRVPNNVHVPGKGHIQRRVSACFQELTKSKILSASQVNELNKLLSKVPKDIRVVICHRDIIPENLLFKNGKVSLIDIGSAKPYFRDYELASVIQGLGLDKKKAQVFLSEYSRAGGNVDSFIKNRDFWRAFGLITKLRAVNERAVALGYSKNLVERISTLKKALLSLN